MARGVKIDNQKAMDIMTSYALTNNYSKTAKECGVSDKTVKKVITENSEEFPKVSKQKKEEFVEKSSRLIDKALDKLDKALEREDIPINNLTTVIGTLYDKRALAKGESTNNQTVIVTMSDEVKELSQ